MRRVTVSLTLVRTWPKQLAILPVVSKLKMISTFEDSADKAKLESNSALSSSVSSRSLDRLELRIDFGLLEIIVVIYSFRYARIIRFH
jgi:hypothetical protein